MTRAPSADHFGVPAKPPTGVRRSRPLPSGLTMYTVVGWTSSQRPGTASSGPSRPDEKAIHRPSGDQLGRKSPPDDLVSCRDAWVATSSSHTCATPPPREETNATVLPSGENAG